jgi:glutamate synthase domain-containing protein 1
MCGIAAFFAKTRDLQLKLGQNFSPMLSCLASRGSDSAGFALYRDPAPSGSIKAVIQHPARDFRWSELAARISAELGFVGRWTRVSNHAIFEIRANEAAVRNFLDKQPELTLMSLGTDIEIFKEMGAPREVISRFELEIVQGTHAIGHTRMATESAVTTAGSHPFSTGRDLCLVHNGSLSNHNRLRRNLERDGIRFRTDNDSEVAAGYLAWQLIRGLSLEQSLKAALEDLDGFFTFAVGTRNGFAVLRDRIACKPAVMAETDEFVAMASEFRSLAHLPGIENAHLWEPDPATVYCWELEQAENPSTKISAVLQNTEATGSLASVH